jgi:hypothetical protein
MYYNPDDVATWPRFDPLIIAHDVGRSRDRSTAVIGGNCPLGPRLMGIKELHELPVGLYGSQRASALAAIDRDYNSNALIVADLSTDASYGEYLYEAFGQRVVGLQISRSGDGANFERRQVGTSVMPVYTIGRSHLLELFHNELQAGQVRMVDGPETRKAFDQLTKLETEIRDTGIVYNCLPGQHDDLGISCAMLAWAAGHPHLRAVWMERAHINERPRPRAPSFGWGAFT